MFFNLIISFFIVIVLNLFVCKFPFLTSFSFFSTYIWTQYSLEA